MDFGSMFKIDLYFIFLQQKYVRRHINKESMNMIFWRVWSSRLDLKNGQHQLDCKVSEGRTPTSKVWEGCTNKRKIYFGDYKNGTRTPKGLVTWDLGWIFSNFDLYFYIFLKKIWCRNLIELYKDYKRKQRKWPWWKTL